MANTPIEVSAHKKLIMENYQNRLNSFFPTCDLLAEKYAREGFFIVNDDWCQCFKCEFIISKNEEFNSFCEDPTTAHFLVNCNCPLVTDLSEIGIQKPGSVWFTYPKKLNGDLENKSRLSILDVTPSGEIKITTNRDTVKRIQWPKTIKITGTPVEDCSIRKWEFDTDGLPLHEPLARRIAVESKLEKLAYALYASKYYHHVKDLNGCCVDKWLMFDKRQEYIEWMGEHYYDHLNDRCALWKNYDFLCPRAKVWMLNDVLMDDGSTCIDCITLAEKYCPIHFARILTIQSLCLRFDTERTIKQCKPRALHFSFELPKVYPVFPTIYVCGDKSLRRVLYFWKDETTPVIENGLPTGLIGHGPLGNVTHIDNWVRIEQHPKPESPKSLLLYLTRDATMTSYQYMFDWDIFKKHDVLIVEGSENTIAKKIRDALIDFYHCTKD